MFQLNNKIAIVTGGGSAFTKHNNNLWCHKYKITHLHLQHGKNQYAF